MDFQLRGQGGKLLDARVTIRQGNITLHSRGGATNGRPARNPDYGAALNAIIEHLSAHSDTIRRVLLDSAPSRSQSEEARTLARREEFVTTPTKELKNLVRTRMKRFGRTSDMPVGEGNSSKRLLIETSLTDAELRRRLRAVPIGQGDGSGLPPSKAPVITSRRPSLPPHPPIIYFNIGWMERYAGAAPDDLTRGGHGYLGSHDHGAESYNFLATKDGFVRGYRPPGARQQINLNQLGGGASDSELRGVLVVWLAREPGTGRTLIVGWYRNARVYRHAQKGDIELNGEDISYSVEARAEASKLLKPVARTFEIRSSRANPGAGFGQNPTWYGSEIINERVWSYVQSLERKKRPKKGNSKPPKNRDPELRRKVERAAVDHATAYFRAVYGNDCPVISVESEAKGWDLEVGDGAARLLIEVKGLLNEALVCELTPNEYEKMQLPANRERYVVYVVNNALAAHPAMPIASVFEHAEGKWRTADGRELKITEKIGAVLSASQSSRNR